MDQVEHRISYYSSQKVIPQSGKEFCCGANPLKLYRIEAVQAMALYNENISPVAYISFCVDMSMIGL
jgi:hypothetical protein